VTTLSDLGSRAFLLRADETYHLNSQGAFFYPDHLKIDNTALSPERVAHQIVEHFALSTNAGG
jgi:hypothetical protein